MLCLLDLSTGMFVNDEPNPELVAEPHQFADANSATQFELQSIPYGQS